MASIINTGTLPENLRPGIHMFYGMAYENIPVVYDRILDVEVSTRAYEEDVMSSTLGLPQVIPEGAQTKYQAGNQMFTTRFRNIKYGMGFVITQEAMEDGVAVDFGKKMAEALKLNMIRARDIESTLVYSGGFSGTMASDGGDGQPVFSNAHPTPAGNFSNVPVTAAALSEASLEQALIDISLYVDNNGQIINCLAEKLIVPSALMFTARRILGNKDRPATADRDINAMVSMGLLSQDDVIVNPYLQSSSTSHWYIKTNQPGLVFFNRKDMQLSDDNEFDTENMKFKGQMRFSVGCSDPRAGYGVNI